MVYSLVTGASGFIGKKLLNALKDRGEKVIGLTSKDLDVTDINAWDNLPKAKYVYHLAGKSFVPDSWSIKSKILETNILGTRNALNYCKQNGAKLIFASSYIYGVPDSLPINEKCIPKPNNPYALSKYISEKLCKFSVTYENIEVTVLRIFNVYGPGQNNNFLIPTIINQLKMKQEIIVKSTAPRRDFIYVDDVVNAFLLSQKNLPGFNVFNIGSGKSFSVKNLVSIIQNIKKTKLPLTSLEELRVNEIPNVVADISEAKKKLGWEPNYSLEEGLKKVLNN